SFGDRQERERAQCFTSLPPSWDRLTRHTSAVTRSGGSAWTTLRRKGWQIKGGDTGLSSPGRRRDLFLDELNARAPMVRASCYQLVLDRKLGEYTLPEGWAIVAGRQSRFGPCRYDADAHTLAESVRSHRLRGGRAGMVRVGDQDRYLARGHRLHSFP